MSVPATQGEWDIKLLEVDRAWAAGFYDGEGWTGIGWSRQGRHAVLRVALAQANDYSSLRKFALIVGVGKLYGPYAGKREGWSPQMFFYAHNKEAHQALMVLWPYLGSVKKKQAQKAIEKWQESKEAAAVLASEARENRKRETRERTHCKRGHPQIPENVYYMAEDPLRPNCRECQRERARLCYQKKVST